MALQAENRRYTFADILTWDESDRIEIINGEAFMMAPPSRIHQEIMMELSAQLHEYLRGKHCKVYPAPFGVRLFEEDGDYPEDVDTMVEPDISVVCDPGKVKFDGIHGAPDLVVEVLSPSTMRNDRMRKKEGYQACGVREYWLVDPENRTIEQYLLQEGKLELNMVYVSCRDYELERMSKQEKAELETHFQCSLYSDFDIALEDVFSGLLP